MNVMRCVIIVEGMETNQTVSALVILHVQLTIKRWRQALLFNDLKKKLLYSTLKTKLFDSDLKTKDSKSNGMVRMAGGSKALRSGRMQSTYADLGSQLGFLS